MQLPTVSIENAVNQLSKLPGIGKKSALRLVIHLLKQHPEIIDDLTSSLQNMKQNTHYCKQCYNIAESEVCSICLQNRRHSHQLCVVESFQDIIAIENTQQYFGYYHVLGGIISPIDGIGPEKLTIDKLLQRLQSGTYTELILALNASIEGDTTMYYIQKSVAHIGLTVTSISRGIALGSELEFTDELTLGRSIITRVPIDYQFTQRN